MREREGSLPPAIAAALVFSATPTSTDVVLDPTCGSGTLLAEISSYASRAKRIGTDIDPQAIAIATENLKHSGDEPPLLLNVDSRNLDAKISEVSLVVANLPFGIKFGDRKTNAELYQSIFEKCYQVRGPKWRAAILTSDKTSLDTALSRLGFLESQELFRVKIRGELAVAVLLTSRAK